MEVLLAALDPLGNVLAERRVMYDVNGEPDRDLLDAATDVQEMGLKALCDLCGNTGVRVVEVAPDDSREEPCLCQRKKHRNGRAA